jgi:hypothetical protein
LEEDLEANSSPFSNLLRIYIQHGLAGPCASICAFPVTDEKISFVTSGFCGIVPDPLVYSSLELLVLIFFIVHTVVGALRFRCMEIPNHVYFFVAGGDQTRCI